MIRWFRRRAIVPTLLALFALMALLALSPAVLASGGSSGGSGSSGSGGGGGGGGGTTPTPTASPAPGGPAAPALIAPANGASVTAPFTISWAAVTDPAGITAYNWQVSPSSGFASVVAQSSTSGATQATVGGLTPGTYFWRVQAVNGNVVQGAWSQARSATITGPGAGAVGTPTLNPPKGATAFHPMESISFTWSAVSGASTYTLDASTDPNFPVVTEVHIDNIPNTGYTLTLGDSEPQGTWYVHVTAVGADRVAGIPSNRDTFTLSFNAPLPPAPTPLTPADGATVSLPVTLTWTDVPNPQESGYVLEIASDPGFKNIAYTDNQITGAHWSVTSLTAGTKYWHVLSTQGDSAPGVPANTAWSATRSFVVPANTTIGSLTLTSASPFSGDTETATIQLTGPAPSGGAVVQLTSSNPSAVSLPASVTVGAGFAFAQFQFQVGQVTTPTAVTLTGTLGASSATATLTVQPPSLKSVTAFSPIKGGSPDSGVVMLNGQAPTGGMVVTLTSSNSAALNPPATVTVVAGSPSVSFNIPTGTVTANTAVTLTATLNGVTQQTQVTVTP